MPISKGTECLAGLERQRWPASGRDDTLWNQYLGKPHQVFADPSEQRTAQQPERGRHLLNAFGVPAVPVNLAGEGRRQIRFLKLPNVVSLPWLS